MIHNNIVEEKICFIYINIIITILHVYKNEFDKKQDVLLSFWTLIISFITSRIFASGLRVDRRRMQRRDNELIFRARKLT